MVELKVDDVVLLGSLWVESGNATVVEVEGDGGGRTLHHRLPLPAMRTDVLDNEHGLVTAVRQQGGTDVIGRYNHEGWAFSEVVAEAVGNSGFAATGTKVIDTTNEVCDDGGLHIVGQTEVEPSQLAAQPVIGKPHLAVSVVGPLLVDHIPDEAVVRG